LFLKEREGDSTIHPSLYLLRSNLVACIIVFLITFVDDSFLRDDITLNLTDVSLKSKESRIRSTKYVSEDNSDAKVS
jgi:hypothetical protein